LRWRYQKDIAQCASGQAGDRAAVQVRIVCGMSFYVRAVDKKIALTASKNKAQENSGMCETRCFDMSIRKRGFS